MGFTAAEQAAMARALALAASPGVPLGPNPRVGCVLLDDAGVTVAEGYPSTRSAYRLARKLGISTPIIDEVHALLYEGKHPAQTVADLTHRTSKAED